jgi:hypothetical protein
MIGWLRQHRCGTLLAVLCLLILADPIAGGLAGLGSFVLTILLLVALGLTAWSLGVRPLVLLALGVLGLLAMAVIFEPPGSHHWR